MSSALKPLGDYVVAQADEAESKTASGLYLPEGAKEKPKTSRVVAVGPAVQGVKVGDRIVYKSYSQTEVKVGRDEYILVQEQDILATVEGK